ncbi:MAG: hypothetical protein V3U87_00670 [Methylococcaceae bacterium]
MAILSQEEKVACSDLYYYATGERLEPHTWNANAAVLLYGFIGELRYCSKAFSMITNLPKLKAGKVSVRVLYSVGKYIFAVWQEFQKINKGEYSKVCEKTGNGYGNYPRLIQEAIIFNH